MSDAVVYATPTSISDCIQQYHTWRKQLLKSRSIFISPTPPPPFVIYYYGEHTLLENTFKKNKDIRKQYPYSRNGLLSFAASRYLSIAPEDKRLYEQLYQLKLEQRKQDERVLATTYQHVKSDVDKTAPFHFPNKRTYLPSLSEEVAHPSRTLTFSLKDLRKQLELDFGVGLTGAKPMIEAIVRTYIDPIFRRDARKAEPQTRPKFGLWNYYQSGVLPEEASVLSPEMIVPPSRMASARPPTRPPATPSITPAVHHQT